MALPYTVQSKLNYLIESLVLPPASDPNAQTALDLLEEILNTVSAPTTQTSNTITVTTTSILIIPVVSPLRKKFFLHNNGSTNIYLDYVNTVSSSDYFLMVKPQTAIIDEINDQRAVYAVSASGSNSVKIRYWS